MRPPAAGSATVSTRPRSSSGTNRRPASVERGQTAAGGAGSGVRAKSKDREAKDDAVGANVRSSSRTRSAPGQPPRPNGAASSVQIARPPRATADSGGGAGGRAANAAAAELEQPHGALQSRCRELKTSTNNTEQENVKMKTRLMALERELKKREGLLVKLGLLAKNGQGLGMDLIEKLREERNLLPIYKKKAVDLQKQIDAKDAEIKDLKRDPKFTRILELQVEYASWQHEAKRIEGLMISPSPEVNPAAKREVQVHDERAQKLEDEALEVDYKLRNAQTDLDDAQAEHERCEQLFKEKETELKQQQETTRQKAVTFKELLQQRKETDQKEGECEALQLDIRKYRDELETLKSASQTLASPKVQKLGRRAISNEVLRQTPQLPETPAVASSLWAVRTAASTKHGRSALLSQFLVQDRDADGLVTLQEMAKALDAMGCQLGMDDVKLIAELLPAVGGDDRIRWLDFLVVLDRLSGCTTHKPPSTIKSDELPDVRALRAACLKVGMTVEDLRRRIQSAASVPTQQQVDALFVQKLQMNQHAANAWGQFWRVHETRGVLLRLPFSEAAPSEESYRSWLTRCRDAVREYRGELDGTAGGLASGAFTCTSADMVMEEFQFKLTTPDVLGAVLSDEDIDDLGLLASIEPNMIDGKMILQLADT